MNETIIGIDPDSNGAVAIIHPETMAKEQWSTVTSLLFVAPGEVDLADMREFIETFRGHGPLRVYIERQRLVFIPIRAAKRLKCDATIPQPPIDVPQKVKFRVNPKSSVTLAKIEWSIRGLLAGMNIPMESIPPGSWKKCFVHGKEPMLPVASRMFPSVVWTGNKLKKEGQATALMLAEWGRREREGRPK